MVPGSKLGASIAAVLVVLVLAAMRLFSERPFRPMSLTIQWLRKRYNMLSKESFASSMNTKISTSRNYFQYVLETTWALGAGVMAAHWAAELVNPRLLVLQTDARPFWQARCSVQRPASRLDDVHGLSRRR